MWQRAWKAPVLDAVSKHGADFSMIVPLGAEVSWKKNGPLVTRIPVDYQALAASGRKVGLALRIGPYSGPFVADDAPARELVKLARSLVSEAHGNAVSIAELQIDFDCAESKLDGYRVWIRVLREAIRPTPLCVTALPIWLEHPEFAGLAADAGAYVLQVHSLERPKAMGVPFTLCDPVAARRAAQRAGRLGVPFRVALPTYGYVLAFDQSGKFLGLSAEGPRKEWPEGSQRREVRADPGAMADLVRAWSENRPQAMTGVIWYRLPVAGDDLNWSWPTLASVIAGRNPQPAVQTRLRRPEPGLVEIDLLNDGDGDYDGPLQVRIRWRAAHLIASDGWHGFKSDDSRLNEVTLEASRCRLSSGERQSIGWLRWDKEPAVELETKTF